MSAPASPFENPFRRALAAGRPLVGLWSMLNASTALEGVAFSGFDWILIDGEHTPLTVQDAIAHLRAMHGSPSAPIVRLPWNDAVLMKQYLDAGVATVMLPYVQSAAEAAAAVSSMRYPPRGTRGVAGMTRASRYGRTAGYNQNADSGLFLIVQIETLAALERLEEIAAVDGVDAVFFGPADLAASMGLLGQPDHPDVVRTIEDGMRRARAAGVKVGALSPSPATSERYLRAGFDFVSVGSDMALLFRAADELAARFGAVARGDGAG
ncbi:HpcH/HpaI aldolase/citrate lyase family protein [Alsobacter sp. SYSU M60028]|uniref:HpcH/HpaI aldolase/citrate lyase family protein n=1 Tax=Alsobacter ponti TaxID=2962936 RepID=A0ABT1LCS1_9HYPH|nr:HpcH/HpaI aldolase/citrate lyase family protein [Alsobacter ponti]MCP8939302.1 HpcH/HpaI aldolase/citrate lyase family protein [Alsobacter ponti]